MWHPSKQPCSNLSLFVVIDVMSMIDCQGGLGDQDGDPCRLVLPIHYKLNCLGFSHVDSVIPPNSLIPAILHISHLDLNDQILEQVTCLEFE